MPRNPFAVVLSLGCLALLSVAACSTTPGTRSGVLDADMGHSATSTPTASAPDGVPLPCIALTGSNPPFTVGSWGKGIAYQGTGFPASTQVTLMLFDLDEPMENPTQSASTDSSGNLNATWSPPTPPQSAGEGIYSIIVQFGDNPPQRSCSQPLQILS